MDQFGQTNNNDLQRAIDEISNESGSPVTSASESIQVNLGEPPIPPTDDFGMPPMDGAKVNPPEPAMSDLDRISGAGQEMNSGMNPEPTPEMSPVGDLAAIRESALKELVPIIDKAGLSAERQFGIIAAVVESTNDKAFISKALEAARAIPDEKLRAEALLKVVGLIDK